MIGFVLLILAQLPSATAQQRTFTVVNTCPFTIWQVVLSFTSRSHTRFSIAGPPYVPVLPSLGALYTTIPHFAVDLHRPERRGVCAVFRHRVRPAERAHFSQLTVIAPHVLT